MDNNVNNNQDNGFNNNVVDNQAGAPNTAQTDYYNNDAYYNNENYNSNYSDTTYEEPEKKNGIWWKILLGILALLIVIVLLLKFCTGGKTGDEKYAELKAQICTAAEKYAEDNEGVIDNTKAGTSATIKLQMLADANLIGAQIDNPYYKRSLFGKSDEPKYYSLNNSVRLTVLNDGSFGCEIVDNSSDVTAPELRLSGDATITIAVGTEFTDPGYTATDDYDGDISSNVVRSGNVDISKAGEYTITYTVSDSAGNTTTKTRKVVVEEYADLDITLGSILDTVTPMISLKGSNPYCMVKGSKYVEPGAVATDNVDGDITNSISVTNKITGNLMGAFRVTYKVEDSSGNQAIAYRAVIVTTECPDNTNGGQVANNLPVITLIGKSSVTIEKGKEYLDLGATAYDKEDGDITSSIVTDSTAVKVNEPGVYKVLYRVMDSTGALATATRIVTVKQDVSGTPSVRFTSTKANITVNTGEGTDSLLAAPTAVNESGVAVAVNTKIVDYVTLASVSSINWGSVGKYRVTYTAVHGNGTVKQTKSIVVTVNASGVEIGGKTTIDVTKRLSLCDLTEADLTKGGVTFTTGESATPIVSINAPSNMVCTIGAYEATVSAKTNTSATTTKKITVNVVAGDGSLDTTAPSKAVITSNSAFSNDVYNNAGNWVGGAKTGVTIGFTSTPAANTQIAYFEWTDDCASNTADGQITKTDTTKGTKEFVSEGKSSVCVRAVTTAGSKGPWSDPIKLYIDRTLPTVAFTDETKNKGIQVNDWHNTDSIVIAYTSTDAGSGVNHFEYTYDDVKAKTDSGQPITTYNNTTGDLTVYESTEITRKPLFVYVRAVDNAGNVGEWTANPAYANLDTIKPDAPTLTVSGNGESVVKLLAKFSDGESIRPSGFGKMIYTVDGGSELTETAYDSATAISTITAPSNTTSANVISAVKVWAVDRAGNKSDGYAEATVTIAPAKIVATAVTLTNGETVVADTAACSPSTIYTGGSFTLAAKPVPVNSNETLVTWTSSNDNVCTVDQNGVVSIKTVGTAVITAKIGSVLTTCKIDSKAQVSNTSGTCDCYQSVRGYCTQSECVNATNMVCTQSNRCWTKTSTPVSNTSETGSKYKCSANGVRYSTESSCRANCSPCPTVNGKPSCSCDKVSG
jgi:hypothetical protein